MPISDALMEVWVVIDLEDGKAWVFFDDNSAWAKKKSRIKKHKKKQQHPHIFLRKLILGTH